jgi:hypothetical protein
MHWFKTQDGYVNLELVQQIDQREGVPGRGGRAAQDMVRSIYGIQQ